MTNRIPCLGLAVCAFLFAACGRGTDGSGIRIHPLTATPGAGASSTTKPAASVSPTPAAVDLPARPANPFTGGIALSAYLAGGRANIEGCLPEVEHAWDLAPVSGPRCVSADLDGDGHKEFALLITLKGDPEPAGEVWFFSDVTMGYRFVTSARALANAVLTSVQFVGVGDLTGDGKPDVVLSGHVCDASGCTTRVVIASAHRGTLENLAPAEASLSAVDTVKLEDRNGDGMPDVVMHRPTTTNATAGPQRGLTRELTWIAIAFHARDRPDDPTYLIHLITDADAAYHARDLATARKLYERAATDTALKDWKAEMGETAGRRELVPYAWFRAALTAQLQGDTAATRLALTRAASAGAGSMLGAAAAVYLTALDAGKAPPQACADTERYLQPFAPAYARAWDYGTANPEHSIADLCA